MSAPVAVSTPTYASGVGHGISHKAVTVLSIDNESRVAVTRDEFGKIDNVRCDIMRAKGNLPAPREQWLIDRQYGQWMFGAIINGDTDGVVIPQSSVTGLVAYQADNDERLTGLTSNTLGKIGGKGDILAGGATGAITPRSPGTLGQYLVTDPSQDSGLGWRDGLALSEPLNGSLGYPGVYVGNTLSGWPNAGDYRRGNWVKDAYGYIWTCTIGSPNAWWSSPSYNAAQPRKHIYSWPIGTVAPNTPVQATGFTPYFDAGTVILNNGVFVLNRQGRWSIDVLVESDCSDAGIFHTFIQFNGASPFGPDNSILRDRRYRAGNGTANTGFPGAGFMSQNLHWTGWVYPTSAASSFTLNFYWACPIPNGTCNATYRIGLEHLGP
jgi:hypothetical protein